MEINVLIYGELYIINGQGNFKADMVCDQLVLSRPVRNVHYA